MARKKNQETRLKHSTALSKEPEVLRNLRIRESQNGATLRTRIIDNKKQYNRNYKGIKGFGRPCYDVKAAKSPEETTTKLIQLQVRQLRKGMSGDDVRTLMLRLKDLGFYKGNITSSDKEFGPKMDAAVREFQSTNKLTVDGIIGNQTWSKILQF